MNTVGKFSKLIALVLVFMLIPLSINAGAKKSKNKKKDSTTYEFKILKEVKRTPARNQNRTGTCWCFSTVSFLESEALRVGKEEVDLSEMFVVRHTYPKKVTNYVRLHGKANHSQGGQAHDVINQVREFGIVPEEIYTGQRINEKRHNHGEMTAILSSLADAVLKRRGRKITPRWLEAYEAVLDIYLGTVPESFSYKGKTYTPKSFADSLGLNMDDYIELTSYSHYPYYKKCRLELPDNWDYNSDYYNVPIDDLERIVRHALQNGYSMVWDGDVSERDFSSYKKGYAVVPIKDWEDKTRAEREAKVIEPIKEKTVTQEMRQETFNNFTTTDDHLMHFVGLAKDQKGTIFYLTKNSGGQDRPYKGHLYMSNSYFRLKTTAILLNKNALPKDMKDKLGIN